MNTDWNLGSGDTPNNDMAAQCRCSACMEHSMAAGQHATLFFPQRPGCTFGGLGPL